MSKSEAVVIESIEVRELLRVLFYFDILNKLSLLQRKHSKYMYAKCLNFPYFITYLAACMHAFCMFYLYVSLGNCPSIYRLFLDRKTRWRGFGVSHLCNYPLLVCMPRLLKNIKSGNLNFWQTVGYYAKWKSSWPNFFLQDHILKLCKLYLLIQFQLL